MFETICAGPLSALVLVGLVWVTGMTDTALHTHALVWYAVIAAVVFAIPLKLGREWPFVSAPLVSFLNTIAVLLYVSNFSTVLAVMCACIAAFLVLWVADLGLGLANDRGSGHPLAVLAGLYLGLAVPALGFWVLVTTNDPMIAFMCGAGALLTALVFAYAAMPQESKRAATPA